MPPVDGKITDLLSEMRRNPAGIRFAAVLRVASHFFGAPRQKGSHVIYRTPWPGDPRVNLQDDGGGKAKAYQVRQLLLAIDRLKRDGGRDGD
jgi:hypothetical protein